MISKTSNSKQAALLHGRYTPIRTTLPGTPSAIKASFENDGIEIPCFIRFGNRELLLKQQLLIGQVENSISVPSVIDFFDTVDTAYLVTEWLPGESLDIFVKNSFTRRNWTQLSRYKRRLLTNYLLQIASLIHQLHQLQFLHGKIQPDKFIVHEDKVYLTDLRSMQVFRTSTEMTTVDEVYNIGLLMLQVFTNYSPDKFDLKHPSHLFYTLLYLLADKEIADLLSKCLQPEAALRPNTDTIIQALDAFMVRIASDNTSYSTVSFSSGTRATINPEDLLFNSLSLLVSTSGPYAKTTTANWYSGLAGLNYLSARCTLTGIPQCEIHATDIAPITLPGLYEGFAGVAVSLAAAGNNNNLKSWFIPPITTDIAQGAAGQGLAALHALPVSGSSVAKQLVTPYIDYLLQHQLSDGSWHLSGGDGLNFSTGIPGIASFLWIYLKQFTNTEVEKAAEKAMGWLHMQKPVDVWKEGTDHITSQVFTYLMAYETTGHTLYKECAEALLTQLPDFWQTNQFDFSRGYAGLGEIYLEASRLLHNLEWNKRAFRLFTELLHMNKQYQGSYYWIARAEKKALPGLITGNAGILHFLMRVIAGADVVPHLLLPKTPNPV